MYRVGLFVEVRVNLDIRRRRDVDGVARESTEVEFRVCHLAAWSKV